MTKPFLILQLRPEDEAAEGELSAILAKGGLMSDQVVRIRLDQSPIPADLNLDDFAGVIVGGGPGCVSDTPDQKSPTEALIETAVLSLMPQVTERDFPYLGCCYGIGILGKHLAGDVSKKAYFEPVGTTDCQLTVEGAIDPLLEGVPARFQAFVGHKEALQTLPQGCTHLISSLTCPYQMVRYGQNVYATQFHPEADSDGFKTRIEVYKHCGYFPPETAQDLIDMCQTADVHAPELILKNFVARYR